MQPPHNLQRQATLVKQTSTQQTTKTGTLQSNKDPHPHPTTYKDRQHSSQTKPTTYRDWHTVVKLTQQPARTGILWSNQPSKPQGHHTVVKQTQQPTRTGIMQSNRHAGKMGRYLPGGRVGTWWMSAHCNQESWETVLWHHVLAGSEQLCLKKTAAILKAQRKKKEKKANTKKNTICCRA